MEYARYLSLCFVTYSNHERKRKIILLPLLLFLIVTACTHVGQPVEKYEKSSISIDDGKRVKPPEIKSIDDLLEEIKKSTNGPDESIDIPYISLLCTQLFYPDTNISIYTYKLNDDADAIKPIVEAEKSATGKIAVLRDFLFSKKEFRFGSGEETASDPDWADAHRWIPQLIETKIGSCISYTFYYIALLDRLGITVYPVALPSHVFLRVRNGDAWLNLEATTGNIVENDFYEKNWKMKEDKYFLTPLSRRQYIGMLLSNHVGFVLNGRQHYKEALVCFEVALRLFPGFPDALTNKGIALRRLDRPDEAISLYKSVLEAYPENRETWINLANAYKDKNDFENALFCFNKSIVIEPRNYELPVYKSMILQARQNRAFIFVNTNKNKEAIEECNLIDSLSPTDPFVLFIRATALGNLGKHEEALSFFSRVVGQDLDPGTRAVMYFNMGNSFHALGRLAEALDCYNKSLAINGQYENALRTKGILLIELDKIKEAYDCIQRALSINPENPANRLVRIHIQSIVGDIEGARGELDAYLVQFPNDANAREFRAQILSDKNDFSKALEDITSAIRAASTNAEFYFVRGIVHTKAGDFAEAIDDFRKTKEINPVADVTTSFDSIVCAKSGKYGEALTLASKAISSKQENLYWAYAAKCIILMHEKKYQDAFNLSDEYTWKAPTDDFLRKELALLRLDALRTLLKETIPPDTNLDEIMDRHIRADGGADAMKKMTTSKSKGIGYYAESGTFFEVEEYRKFPNLLLSIVNDMHADIVKKSCYNGKSGWEFDSLFGYRDITGVKLNILERTAMLASELKWKELSVKTELCGMTIVSDKPAYVIIFTPTSGYPRVTYIDKETFLTVKEEWVNEVDRGIEPQTLVMREYGDVEGIKVPIKLQLNTLSGDIEIKYTENKINIPIDDKIFERQ